MSSNKITISGREYLLLPVEVLGTIGETIRKSFELIKRHLEYVKITEFVPEWIKRDVHWITNNKGEKVACYALSIQEYKILKKAYDDSLVPF